MYCNSCQTSIKTTEYLTCHQCGVPLHEECSNRCLSCNKVLCDVCFAQNEYKCITCYNPEQTFKTIRRSHLDLFEKCPYSLYLQLVKNVDVPNDYPAELGILVHHIIDLYSTDVIKEEDIFQVYEEKWNEKFGIPETFDLTEEELKDLYTKGSNCIFNFLQISGLLPKPKHTEYNIIFQVEPNLPSISCTIDRIDLIDEKYHILDWKTGKAMSGQQLINDIQVPLYIYAVYKEFGSIPETFTLHYLNDMKVKKYQFIGDWKYEVKSGRNTYILDVMSVLERIKEILLKIQNKQFGMPKDVHQWYCTRMCYFGKTGMCNGSEKEQWKVLNDKYINEK